MRGCFSVNFAGLRLIGVAICGGGSAPVLCPVWRPLLGSRYVRFTHAGTPAVIEARDFRRALGAFPTGVTIVTARSPDGADVGLTVNSFNSVSLDPPLILWSLAKSSVSMQAFEDAETFVIHVLAASQEELATRFATRNVDRFAGLDIARGNGGAPLIPGCAALFECRKAHLYEGGDHVIFVGEVLEFDRSDKPVLAFHGGKYALALQKSIPARAQVPNETLEPAIDMNGLNVLLGVAYHHLLVNLEPHLARRGLSEQDYWLLQMIGSEEGRSLAQLNSLLRFGPEFITVADGETLRAGGLIRLDGAGTAATATLTEKGKQTLVELGAVAKSVETAAEANLDYAEASLLHQLLRRLIFSMRPPHDNAAPDV